MNDGGRICDAWNPGLTSEIPKRLLPLVTLYRAENSDVDYAHAKEMAELCGLEAKDAIAFRVERLIVHELLIRLGSSSLSEMSAARPAAGRSTQRNSTPVMAPDGRTQHR